MTYSVLRLLISFQEVTWWKILYYVQAVTTTLQGYCATSIRFRTYKVMVSYQYMCALSDHAIHLIIFICSYCTFIYNKYFILLCFIINIHKILLITQISDQLLCEIL